MTPTLIDDFVSIVRTAFEDLHFEVEDFDTPATRAGWSSFLPDLVIRRGVFAALGEVKFYRSTKVPNDVLRNAAKAVASYPSDEVQHRAVIISCIVSDLLKKEILESYNVVVWDRSNLANFLLEAGRDDKLEELGKLIMEAQQGSDTQLPYEGVNEDTDRDPLSYFRNELRVADVDVKYDSKKKEENRLIADLNGVPIGKSGWAAFENKCTEILQYLFGNDLSAWQRQQRTDDELLRFDMICRVNSQDDFWRALVDSFYSRYVLFEFKNYKDPIPPSQIYTTERYLFPKALRSTAIIVARNGAHANAITASKGALREHGKLILILDTVDLIEMIRMKDNGDLPSDYLSNKLDDHLISLSR